LIIVKGKEEKRRSQRITMKLKEISELEGGGEEISQGK